MTQEEQELEFILSNREWYGRLAKYLKDRRYPYEIMFLNAVRALNPTLGTPAEANPFPFLVRNTDKARANWIYKTYCRGRHSDRPVTMSGLGLRELAETDQLGRYSFDFDYQSVLSGLAIDDKYLDFRVEFGAELLEDMGQERRGSGSLAPPVPPIDYRRRSSSK